VAGWFGFYPEILIWTGEGGGEERRGNLLINCSKKTLSTNQYFQMKEGFRNLWWTLVTMLKSIPWWVVTHLVLLLASYPNPPLWLP